MSIDGIEEEVWREKYGFWNFEGFRIDVKDGNTTIADFRDGVNHYVIFY